MRRTFKMKALFFMIPILVIVSGIFTFESIRTEKQLIRSEIVKRAETVTTLATKTGELPLLSGNPELMKSMISFLRTNSEVSSVTLYDRNMAMLVHDGPPIEHPIAGLPPNAPISMTETSDSFNFYAPIYTVRTQDDFAIFQDSTNVKTIKENIGWIRLSFSKSSMQANERKIVERGLLLLAIFATASCILAYFLISVATRPLSQIVKVAHGIANGDFSQEIDLNQQDEIGTLARAFSSMKNSIQHVLQETERLIQAVQAGKLETRSNAGAFEGDWRNLVEGVNNLAGAFVKSTAEIRELNCLLQESKEELELRVMERTAELARANSELQAEIVVRKSAEENELKLERQLRQSRKMEAIGTLAAGIAHDFNNILTAIVGFTELSLTRLPSADPVRADLEVVLESGLRATDLVRQILTFSRQTELERKPVRLDSIIKEVLKLLRSSLPSFIEIRTEYDINPEECVVDADLTQVHQVLMNLCTNASHAMRRQGGVLSVILARVMVDAALVAQHPSLKPGHHVRLTVSDTGHGMDATLMERIFDPYFTTKKTGEGTGMGLAVTMGIVQNHGGAIAVSSQPGQGTSFQVFLPRAMPDDRQVIETREPLHTGNEHILFIDDEKALAVLGQKMLETLGYRVTTGTNSLEALELFRSQPDAFDLVITDMTMPGLTGRELARELLSIRQDIPVLMCSGFAEFINAEEAREAGIREFLMKPYVIGTLAKTIRKVL